MASRVYETQITVPKATPIANPVSQPWVTEDATIETIELLVPPGHNGLTGIRVNKGDVSLLPFNSNTWIVANDYNRAFPVEAYIPTGDVTIQAYNTGGYAHTFYLRMTVSTYDPNASSSVTNVQAPVTEEPFTVTPDPLSPDGILGPETAAALSNGTMTAEDVISQSVPSDLEATSGIVIGG